jgi:alpha-glucosidase
MQWDNSLPNAGFTSGRPWLPVGSTPSVRDQDRDGSSTLSLYRRLLGLRRSNPALVEGTIENVVAHGDVLTYERRCRNQRLFMALNMGFEDATVQFPAGVLLLSTLPARDGEAVADGDNRIASGEALIVSV